MVLCPNSGVDVLFESNIDDGKFVLFIARVIVPYSLPILVSNTLILFFIIEIDGAESWINADLVAVVEAEGIISICACAKANTEE
jgi:hypothetical protein